MKRIAAGVDLTNISKVAVEKKEYDGCFLGRLQPQKGLSDLVDIWDHICKNKPDAKLAIIGKGSPQFENFLKNKINGKNLERNINLVGFLEEKEKFKIMKSSKVFVFPSTYESWGLAVCEAMACGLPVVAYDLPIFRLIYPNGLVFVPVGNKRFFAESVLKIIRDKKIRKKISHDAIRMASTYGWDKIAHDSFKAFLAILNKT